jgi:hypothetical protein
MTINATTNLALWAAQGLLAITMGLVGWNVNREYARNDNQEQRIQAIERTIVKMDFMSDDIKEIKTDMKKVLRGSP